MTVIDLVKEYFPTASDEDATDVLWECTGFAGFWTGDPETCLKAQLMEASDHSGGDPMYAVAIAHTRMDIAMAEMKADRIGIIDWQI